MSAKLWLPLLQKGVDALFKIRADVDLVVHVLDAFEDLARSADNP